ncbi:MAG: hypothetical protein LF885_06965 [Rickettsia endosymbiont of Culicoides impunctatus]|nr:MAG: hypothetical protein LF885_06965 [Rickettsia endosymbiont of Culicoides impunctatus]
MTIEPYLLKTSITPAEDLAYRYPENIEQKGESRLCEQNFNCLDFEYFKAKINKIFAGIVSSISKKSYNLQLKRVEI